MKVGFSNRRRLTRYCIRLNRNEKNKSNVGGITFLLKEQIALEKLAFWPVLRVCPLELFVKDITVDKCLLYKGHLSTTVFDKLYLYI